MGKEKKLEAGNWRKGDCRGSWRKVLRCLRGHGGALDIQDIMIRTGLAYTTVKRAVWKIQNHPNIQKTRHPEKSRGFTYQWVEG